MSDWSIRCFRSWWTLPGVAPPLALPKVIFADFLRDALLDLQTDASRRGVQLVVEGALPDIRVRLDKPRFTRVFMNLSQNAFDAVSGLPDPRLTLRLGQTASHVIVEFVDNGKGIEPKNLPHLFEPFFTYGKAQGTGLGLPICDASSRIMAARSPPTVSTVRERPLPLFYPSRPPAIPGRIRPKFFEVSRRRYGVR